MCSHSSSNPGLSHQATLREIFEHATSLAASTTLRPDLDWTKKWDILCTGTGFTVYFAIGVSTYINARRRKVQAQGRLRIAHAYGASGGCIPAAIVWANPTLDFMVHELDPAAWPETSLSFGEVGSRGVHRVMEMMRNHDRESLVDAPQLSVVSMRWVEGTGPRQRVTEIGLGGECPDQVLGLLLASGKVPGMYTEQTHGQAPPLEFDGVTPWPRPGRESRTIVVDPPWAWVHPRFCLTPPSQGTVDQMYRHGIQAAHNFFTGTGDHTGVCVATKWPQWRRLGWWAMQQTMEAVLYGRVALSWFEGIWTRTHALMLVFGIRSALLSLLTRWWPFHNKGFKLGWTRYAHKWLRLCGFLVDMAFVCGMMGPLVQQILTTMPLVPRVLVCAWLARRDPIRGLSR
jgi:hypothetical protein